MFDGLLRSDGVYERTESRRATCPNVAENDHEVIRNLCSNQRSDENKRTDQARERKNLDFPNTNKLLKMVDNFEVTGT